MANLVNRATSPTLSDVAKAAGVAISSVSRALTGHPDVSDTMRAKVLEAADRLDYEPDFVAQSLRSGSTMTVALLARDISNPLFAQIARGAESASRDAGYSIMLVNSDGSAKIEADHVRNLRRRRVDGYLVSLVDEAASGTMEELNRTGAAIVLVDRESPQLQAAAVLSDHYHGMRAAVEQLVSSEAAERVGMITGGLNTRPTRERLRGLRDGLASASIELDRSLMRTHDWSEASARSATEELLALDDPPSAVIAGGAQSTVGVISVIARTSPKRRPALIVCDDVPLLGQVPFPLGVVSRDATLIGRTAAELLLEMLQGEPPRFVTLPTTFEPRNG